MSAAIEFRDVGMTFPTREGPVHTLDGLSFGVEQGEFVSIVGPSGCGKTTLVRLAAGLLQPTGGAVRVEDRDVVSPLPNVGIVFQSPVLMAWRTTLGNIMLQAEIRRLDQQQLRKRAAELIDLVGLTGFEHRYPYQLSGGMQQRVSICRALLHDPALLLMDEPFGAIDALTREHMNLELQRIWLERKKTVLFVTHSIPEAVFLSDRVVVLSHRPTAVLSIVDTSLPRPRTLESMTTPAFSELVATIRRTMQAHGGLE